MVGAVRAHLGLGPINASTVVDAPRLSESWFCCAEPTSIQLRSV